MGTRTALEEISISMCLSELLMFLLIFPISQLGTNNSNILSNILYIKIYIVVLNTEKWKCVNSFSDFNIPSKAKNITFDAVSTMHWIYGYWKVRK